MYLLEPRKSSNSSGMAMTACHGADGAGERRQAFWLQVRGQVCVPERSRALESDALAPREHFPGVVQGHGETTATCDL
jgi:hypothetical protein